MSKIFSAVSSTKDSRYLEVSRGSAMGDVNLVVAVPNRMGVGICIPHDDLPALCLAILEAGGHRPVAYGPECLSGNDLLAYIAHKLAVHVSDEAKRTEEAAALEKLTKRRAEVMNELRGDSEGSYDRCTTQFQRAIDRIIELEDKAQS